MFGRDIVSETDITITLAEHLLGKLAPGHTYVIDHRVKEKENVNVDVEYSQTLEVQAKICIYIQL